MTADIELARLEGTAAEARARVRVGATLFAGSAAMFALAWAALGQAIMMGVVLAFAAGGAIGGIALMAANAVRGVAVRRSIRALKQLPAARLIDR